MKDKWILMNEEDKVCLWNVYPFCASFYFDLPKLTKLPAYSNIFEFDNYHFRGFFLEQESLKNSQFILRKVLKNPKYFSQVKDRVVKSSAQFYDFGKKILKLDPKNLSNRELVQLFNQYFDIFRENVTLGMVSTLIDIPHGIFTKAVETILEERVNTLGLDKSAAEYFQILSRIKEMSKAQEEGLGIFELLAYVQDHKIKTNRLADDKLFQKKVKAHLDKFCWVYYSYMGPVFGKDKIVDELAVLMKEKKHGKTLLKGWAKEYRKIDSEALSTEKELKLNLFQRQVMEALRETMRMKVIRKDALVYANYSLESALKEVAKRSDISFADAHFIAPHEFGKILKQDKKIIRDLPVRRGYSLTIAHQGRQLLLSGQKGRKLLKSLYQELKHIQVNEITGQVACTGQKIGRVKIINVPSDMAKMEKGDILVSIATIPDLVPAMKKAGAIVTEMGGITSHAAIVSRELGVPCVIGTKIATKVFKDGDLVDVDANKGVVRLVETKARQARKI